MPSPYTPLSRPNSIRLLNIDPAADPASPLVCTLEEIDLHAQDATYRAFSALSYRWGPPEPSRSITLNGEPVSVRQNLHDFLLVARRKACCHLWIDALCINQSDGPEKAGQLSMMGTIYSLASRVLVWLGRLSFEEVHALWEVYDFVEEVPLVANEYARNESEESDKIWAAERRRKELRMRLVEGVYRPDLEVMFTKTTVRGLVKLLQNEYWTRKWILQELLLAGPNATIINDAVRHGSGPLEADRDSFPDSIHRPVPITAIAPMIHKIISQIQSDHWVEYRRRHKEWKQRTDPEKGEFTYPPSGATEDQKQLYKLRNFFGCPNTSEGPAAKNGVEKLWKALSQASMTYTPQPLMQLIDTFKDHGCAEREDHVYALVGLSTLSQDKKRRLGFGYGHDIMILFFETQSLVQDEMCGHHIACLEKAMGIKAEDTTARWRRKYDEVKETLKPPSVLGDLDTMIRYMGLIGEREKARQRTIELVEGRN